MTNLDKSIGVSLASYTAEAWKRLQSIPESRIDTSFTYAHLLHKIEKIERDFVAQGVKYKKVAIDVDQIDQMIAWCHRNGYEIDSKGRSVYGSVLAMAQDDPSVLDNPITDNTRNIH
jgi:hypothetical protein